MTSKAFENWWLPPDISTHGHRIDYLINFLHVFMIVLFVAWGIFLVYCLVRFRSRPGHSAQYDLIKAKPSKYAEVAVVVVEAFILVALSMPVWADFKDTKDIPKKEQALEVEVVAQQFAWNVRYPGPDGKFGPRSIKLNDETENPLGLDRKHPDGKDDITTVNTFKIPINRPVIVHLMSKDVLHSFWIPVLRVKQDTVPGMRIPIWFEATQTGQFEIACAQLCGLGHYRMRGSFQAMEETAFNDWLKQQAENISEDEDDFGEE